MKTRVIIPSAVAVAAFLLIAIATGERPDPQPLVRNGSFEVLVYRDGRPEMTGRLTPKSPGTDAILALLETKQGRWRRSFVSYAPQIYLRSPDLTLNFQSSRIVLNSKNKKGNLLQYVTSLTPGEFEQVTRAIKESMNH